MPFLAWINSSHREGVQSPNCAASMAPSRVLLQELLWQLEQRECPALEEEHHRCAHNALRFRRPLTRDSMLALIPASEYRLLERLCARIPLSHTAAVLFRYVNVLVWVHVLVTNHNNHSLFFFYYSVRFREILAHNYVVPWELVCIFKQVLKDFLKRQEEASYRSTFPPTPPILRPVSPPLADINARGRKTANSSSLERQEKHREEIPTISSYVDRHLHNACSYAVHRDCLPYCHSFPYD